MRYFLYDYDSMDEYLDKYNDNSSVLVEIDIMSDENKSNIRKCVNKIGELKFKQLLYYNGLRIKNINFTDYTFTPFYSTVVLNLSKLSCGQRIIFFVSMARVLDLDFIGQGFITVLSKSNRERMWRALKKCKYGTVIVNSSGELPIDCKNLGGGYYGY